MEHNVQLALYAGLDIAINNLLPVQYPLRSFKVPTDGKWFEIVRIVNNSTNEFWGNERTFRGIVRVILHWPIVDSGEIAPTKVLETVAANVKKGTEFVREETRIQITDHPMIDEPIVESNGRAIMVLTLQYRSYVI